MASAPMTKSLAPRSARSADSPEVDGWCTYRHTILNRPRVLPIACAYPRHIFEVTPMLERSIARWVRADAAALFVITLWVVTTTHSSWIWFWGLFLAPDLSMIGYVFGPRVGAVTYNAGRLYAWPAGVLAAGVAYHAPFATTVALSWIAHIAF